MVWLFQQADQKLLLMHYCLQQPLTIFAGPKAGNAICFIDAGMQAQCSCMVSGNSFRLEAGTGRLLLHWRAEFNLPGEFSGFAASLQNWLDAVMPFCAGSVPSETANAYLSWKLDELLQQIKPRISVLQHRVMPGIVEKLLYIDQLFRNNPDSNFTLAQLARLTCLNLTHLKKYFRQYYGQSIHRYQLQLKIAQADTWLLQPDKTIKSIGYDLGFSTQANFCAAYRRIKGFSPGRFRISRLSAMKIAERNSRND